MASRADREIVNIGRLAGRRLLALLAGSLLISASAAAFPQADWPQLSIPKAVNTFDMGGQLTANGLPMRLRGFISEAKPAVVASLFRQSLGEPLVEDRLGSKLVLGRAQGAHYLTVQMEPAGSGTRGVIAVAEVRAAIDNREALQKAERHLLSRLPAGSNLISRTASIDGKNRADHVVLTNTHSPELNANYVKSMLDADGFNFERETPTSKRADLHRGTASLDRRTLFFRRAGGEATAVIFRANSGKTAIVLNTISHAEPAK